MAPVVYVGVCVDQASVLNISSFQKKPRRRRGFQSASGSVSLFHPVKRFLKRLTYSYVVTSGDGSAFNWLPSAAHPVCCQLGQSLVF